jgi:hypothetical protein
MKKRWQLRGTEGQSLVEMALTLPFLIVMFAGLIEVGYALHNYIVVVNANREGTRFAARGRWFDTDEEVDFIFERVLAAAGTDQRSEPFMRTQAVGELPANAMIAVHYIEIPDQVNEVGGLEEQAPVVYGPWVKGIDCDRCVPLTEEQVLAIAVEARSDNYEFNRKYFLEDGLLEIPSEDNFVIIETWYEHEQLLKLPFFTQLFEALGAEDGKLTLYARTQMRVTLSRELFGDEG